MCEHYLDTKLSLCKFIMTILKEYHISMPMTVDKYEIGKIYSTARASLEQSGGGEGVEVVKNQPFHNMEVFGDKKKHSGQYYRKIYHLKKRVPSILSKLAPKGSLEVHEESWSASHRVRTLVTNPGYMAENFFIKIDSIHYANLGDSENIFNLSPEDLKIRDIITIDIAKDNQPGYTFPPELYKPEEDPKLITLDLGTSTVGPLKENWSLKAVPVMTVYKLVRIRFNWRGFQGWIEGKIADFERNLFTVFNRKVYCWMDQWYHMTLEDARKYEATTFAKLDDKRKSGRVDNHLDMTL